MSNPYNFRGELVIYSYDNNNDLHLLFFQFIE